MNAYIPLYDHLLVLARQHDAFLRAENYTAARAVREEAQCILEQWFNDHEARWLADADEMEQVAAAREHIRATQERWTNEAETSGIPF